MSFSRNVHHILSALPVLLQRLLRLLRYTANSLGGHFNFREQIEAIEYPKPVIKPSFAICFTITYSHVKHTPRSCRFKKENWVKLCWKLPSSSGEGDQAALLKMWWEAEDTVTCLRVSWCLSWVFADDSRSAVELRLQGLQCLFSWVLGDTFSIIRMEPLCDFKRAHGGRIKILEVYSSTVETSDWSTLLRRLFIRSLEVYWGNNAGCITGRFNQYVPLHSAQLFPIAIQGPLINMITVKSDTGAFSLISNLISNLVKYWNNSCYYFVAPHLFLSVGGKLLHPSNEILGS